MTSLHASRLFFKPVRVTLAFYHYPFLSRAKVLMNSDVHTTHTLLATAAVAKVLWGVHPIYLHKAPEDPGQGKQSHQPLCCPYCCQPLENLCQAPPPPLKGLSWRMHSAWPHRQVVLLRAWYHPAHYFFSENQILLSTEVFREGERCWAFWNDCGITELIDLGWGYNIYFKLVNKNERME